MKTIMKNFTVLFAAALSLIACSGNKSSSSAQSSENNPSQSTTPSVVPSSTSSSAQPSSSSTQPSSSSVQPSNSSVKPSSSSTQPSSSSAGSSSSGGGTTNKTEYIFEAECTDLSGKRGPGYSGAATERNMASSNNERAFVTYLYAKGISVNFVIQSDKEVDDVVFKACLGGEFMEVLLDPTSYQFRIDSVTEDDITEAAGAWDADFLNYYTSNPDPDHKTTIIDPWECEEIYIPAMGAQSPVGFQEFTITSHLKLYKGYTSISLITANNTNPHLGTMAAIAPVIDYISLTTDATLDMKIHKDNGQGNTYMHTK